MYIYITLFVGGNGDVETTRVSTYSTEESLVGSIVQ
jgi:hypothetical protein